MSGVNPKEILILGHSLISRLSDYMASDNTLLNFGLVSDSCHLKGRSGGTIDSIMYDLPAIMATLPRITVTCLQVAGNDLGKPKNNPELVVRNLCRLIDILQGQYHVRRIVVCKPFRGAKTRPHKGDVSVFVYNNRVRTTNALLEKEFSGRQDVLLWYHDKYIWNELALYIKDGVHFSDSRPYYKSLKGCVLFGLRSLN